MTRSENLPGTRDDAAPRSLCVYNISATEPRPRWPWLPTTPDSNRSGLVSTSCSRADYGSEHPTTGDTAHQHHTGTDRRSVHLAARPPRGPGHVCPTATTHYPAGDRDIHPPPPPPAPHGTHDVSPCRTSPAVASCSASARGGSREGSTPLDVPFEEPRHPHGRDAERSSGGPGGANLFSHDGPLFSSGTLQLSPRASRRAAHPRRQHRTSAPSRRHGRRRLVQLRDTVARRRHPAP